MSRATKTIDPMLSAQRAEDSQRLLDLLSGGKKLSARTISKRTGMSNKYILGATKALIESGKLRRVEPHEVGSGKFYCHWCLPETHENYIQNLRLERNANLKYGDKKRRVPKYRRFHVFTLV